MNKREERLMPDGVPKYIRCYDSGPDGSADRYTVVYTGKASGFSYVGMSGSPYHPQGVCQHGEGTNSPIDKPTYGHLGKKIKFADLPEDCKKVVISDYKELWRIE